jgi:competence protein ComEC
MFTRVLNSVAVFLLVAGVARAGDGKLEVLMLDVGQGDAAVISTPGGKVILVDGGPPAAAGDVLRAARRFAHGRPLEAVVLTHPHADHAGGIVAVLRDVGARAFYDPVLPYKGPLLDAVYRVVGEQARDGRLEPHRVRAGETAALDTGDGARVEFLGPLQEPRDPADTNSGSVVLRVVFGQTAVLLVGDATREEEADLLDRGGGAGVKADVLKVGHHGSSGSSGGRFLAAVRPRVAVISVGAGNDYHHPSPGAVARLAAVGATVLRTDESGSVYVVSDGAAVTVGTERAGPITLPGVR